MIKNLQILVLGIIIGVLLVGIIFWIAAPSRGEPIQLSPNGSETKISVFIVGEVIKPGYYEINRSSRVNDLVKLAGGMTDLADQTRINLAEKLHDGQKVIIPAINQVSMKQDNSSQNGSDTQPVGGNTQFPININIATADELDQLDGIGPEKAETIIEYREKNGSFRSIDEIMNVPGIGQSTFEQIKEQITVN